MTCHFFKLLALDIGALAVCMIELCSQALLINPIVFAPLCKPSTAAAFLAAVTMAAVARAANIKNLAASRTSANPLAKLYGQDVAVFLKAGLDNE